MKTNPLFLTSILLIASQSPSLQAQTLTQHWKMDEASLTFTAGLAPIVNNGTVATLGNVNNANDIPNNPFANQTGATSATATSIRTRTRFQRIQLGNISPTTNAFTMAIWFRRDGTAASGMDSGGDQEHILSGNQGQAGRWNLSASNYNATTKSFTLGWFHHGGFSPTLATNLQSNTWYHFAVTRETTSGAIRFYLNGQLIASGTDTATFTNSTNGVLIGRDPGFANPNRGFIGNFDDVRLYNGTISQSAVINLVGDTDSDGLPDTWEITNFIQSGEDPAADATTILARHDNLSDPDGDNLNNLAEFNAGTNPSLADTDNDGLSDDVETNTGTWVFSTNTGTNPLKPDTDGDGLLDGQETNTGTLVSVSDTGTNPLLADTDADTFNDYLEIARGTSPVSAASTPGTFSPTPLVSLDATMLATGTLSSWNNTGTLSGSFDATLPTSVESISGIKGVTFTGLEVMRGPIAPSNLTANSPRTIRAWIFNPTTSTEETIVAWGRRGGPNGTSSALFHGTSPAFGAVGNWGTPDIPWGPDAPSIANNVKIGSWTYLVYTFDGGASNVGNVYVNGVLANTKLTGALNTFAIDNTPAARPLSILLGGQNEANGTISNGGQKASLTIARLEIHDRVLPSSDLGFADTDGDGMTDWYEDFYGLDKNTNDAATDSDNDGLTNLQELAAGTNPNNPDTDGDGMSDGWELANFGNQNALPLADPDLDGSTNLEEFSTPGGLTIVRNENGTITGTTPFSGPSNPNNANSQPDEDDDDLPDGWEYTFFFNLDSSKTDDNDSDTFNNEAEFLAGSNPVEDLSTPLDIDADSLPDAWELENFANTSQSATGDPDADGSINLDEFLSETDPNDPLSQPNTDGDNLPDGFEYIHFGNLDQDNTGDFDNDTFTNLTEFTAGSNPARTSNTPDNVNATTQVAVATATGIEEYSVTNGNWTFVRTIVTLGDSAQSIVFHNGFFYATIVSNTRRIVRINPSNGNVTDIAVRNTGDALAAGWIASDPQGIEIGPDGKLYFSTAFGNAGEGVFRLNPDGSGFEKFIARTGSADHDSDPETPDQTWDLNNARDLAWNESSLYVSARGGFGAINRPIYQFNSTGAYVAALSNSLVAPQGLAIDQDGLLVTSTNAGVNALYVLSLTDTPPVSPISRAPAGTPAGLDVIDLNGDTYVVTFNSGPGAVGQILRRNFNGSYTAAVNALPTTGNDLAIFSITATPYELWAQSFGIDPDGENGAETADFDEDGTPNGVEFSLGLNPTDSTSRFSITTTGTPDSGLTLTWPSSQGISFEVRSSADLTDWSTLETTIIGQPSETTATWTAPAGTTGSKFYRIEFTP